MEQRLSNSDRESSCKDIDFILQVVYDGLAIWVTKSSTKTYVLDRERRSRSDETISRGERRSHASEADEHTRFHESTSSSAAQGSPYCELAWELRFAGISAIMHADCLTEL
jgi:hypothetical protein